jgi:hypothetical protein
LAWADAREEEQAAHLKQRHPVVRQKQHPDAHQARWQRAARQQTDPPTVARGVAVEKVVDQGPQRRAWVRHQRVVELRDAAVRRVGESELPRAEPQAPPRELRLHQSELEQESALSAQV